MMQQAGGEDEDLDEGSGGKAVRLTPLCAGVRAATGQNSGLTKTKMCCHL